MSYNSKYTGQEVEGLLDKIGDKVDSDSLAKVATSGSYNDLSNKPTIPAAQVNADWNATSGKAQILNKPIIPAAVTESTVSGWGFTKNNGTVTKVKVNGVEKSPTNGIVDLGATMTMASCNGKDFNTIKTSGWYYGYQNMTNAAYPNSISVLEVLVYTADWVVQRQTRIGNIDSSNTDTWERHFYNGNTWSKWAKVSNAQADWNTDNAASYSYIKNKPTIPNEALISSWGFQKITEWVDVPVRGTTTSDYYIEISNMQPNKVYVHSNSNKVKDIVINGFTKINEIGDIYTLIFTTSAELNASLSFSDSGDDYILMFPDGTPPALEMNTTYELSIMRVVKDGVQQYHIITIPFYKQLI
jgi:hypothetical protein